MFECIDRIGSTNPPSSVVTPKLYKTYAPKLRAGSKNAGARYIFSGERPEAGPANPGSRELVPVGRCGIRDGVGGVVAS